MVLSATTLFVATADVASAKKVTTLAKPTDLMPANGAVIVAGSPLVMSWSPVENAKSYTMDLQISYQGQTGTVQENVKKPYLSADSSLLAGWTITWRVRAVNKDVVSDWSDLNTFTVVAPLTISVTTSDGTYSGQVVSSGDTITIADGVSVTLTASESGYWYLTPPLGGGPAGQINIMPSNSVTIPASRFSVTGDYQVSFQKVDTLPADWSATITVTA